MAEKIAIPSAEFIRNIGRWQSEALRQPVVITHHGRARLVLAAPDLLAAHNDGGPQGGELQGQLSALRLLHHEVLDNIEEGYLELSGDGSIQSANNAAIAFLGLALEDLRGMQPARAFSDMMALLIADRVQRVLRTRRQESFEARAADGRSLAVRVIPAGAGAILLFRNTTEHRLQESRLEESHALAAAIAASSPAALVKLDLRGRIEEASARFCQWMGFAAADIAGHRLADLMPPSERRRFTIEFERTLRDLADLELDAVFLARQGQELRFHAMLTPIQSDFVARGALILLLHTQERH